MPTYATLRLAAHSLALVRFYTKRTRRIPSHRTLQAALYLFSIYSVRSTLYLALGSGSAWPLFLSFPILARSLYVRRYFSH
jgi:hypothetical protein